MARKGRPVRTPFPPPPARSFELTIDIDRLIEETDADGSGEIDYEEFKAMLS